MLTQESQAHSIFRGHQLVHSLMGSRRWVVLKMVARGTSPRPGKQRDAGTWPHLAGSLSHHAQVLLAGNSTGGVSLRVMAWVVASKPPGCRGSGNPGVLAIPADFIWAQGMENLFHAVLRQSREPESEQISPWERSPCNCVLSQHPIITSPPCPLPHQPTSPPPSGPGALPCRACCG